MMNRLLCFALILMAVSNAVVAQQEQAEQRTTLDPYGTLRLVDEIETAHVVPESQHPENSSRVEDIIGQPCRVIPKSTETAAYFSYRIGKEKGLQPGIPYVLEVVYPEDAPRSVIVMNGANETSVGFHTGTTFGDALHPKYVNNLNESLDLPLSGKYERWTNLFYLHDLTPDRNFIRGDKHPRTHKPSDGFTVTVAQFSAENIPLSHGAAVSRIRLYAVQDQGTLVAQHQLPSGLPHRRLFWREEMSDGVVSGKLGERGVANRLDWWKFKRDRMKFLGFNTFSKDLLEFGAVQHWDTTAGGGNDWAYFNGSTKDLWPQIVQLMGDAGFDVLPYYEYSGSKGSHGLGNERRAKPLTRDDAYSNTSWIETANADITDPATYEDFKKMLRITVADLKDRAQFAGAWIRCRGQIPISFADATLKRYSNETGLQSEVTRQDLVNNHKLLKRYKSWWKTKRHDFLVAMRDYLRENGIAEANVVFTAEIAESGVSFPTWDSVVVADDTERLFEIRRNAEATADSKQIAPVSISTILSEHLYLEALKAEKLNWGGWELDHRDPPSDPETYSATEGVLLTHAFNRLYTVSDKATLDAFRSPSGLALVRHFSLNEDMMRDESDQPLVGYFVVDFERAGPFCMMAEAHAVANGDPFSIGYLSGGNFNRVFPSFVRIFTTALLSLTDFHIAIVSDATSDSDIVVRRITTPAHGDYFAIVSLSKTAKTSVKIELPISGVITDAASGSAISSSSGRSISLPMHPFQLRAIRVQPIESK